ncbi:DUF2721 domain-containing protein [Falsiroseomonas oryzae]|uniref:DUF2721 domain-containing protein n=1 Tax=Falsiroseomonas oryzae TaxID=2766473 RepID=UPI0022EA6FC3|nr:DUF2721 domain-containing protein [Roseomonas sp. MO-31]
MLTTGHDLLTVERALQVALAPAFVISGIMAVLNLLNSRFQRIGDQERSLRDAPADTARRLHPILRLRGRLTYAAIVCGILASISLCLLVIVSFVEPIFGIGAGVHVVGLLVLGMVLLTAALLLLLMEMLLSVRALDRGES